MWNVWPNESEFRSWPMRGGGRDVRAAVGFGARRRRALHATRLAYCACWLPAVYLTLLHMIFVSSLRYREPAMLPLIVLAAAAVVFYIAGGSQGSAPAVPDLREA